MQGIRAEGRWEESESQYLQRKIQVILVEGETNRKRWRAEKKCVIKRVV